MSKIYVTNIVYETDGNKGDLPTEMTFTDDITIADDELRGILLRNIERDWLVRSFDYQRGKTGRVQSVDTSFNR